MKEKSRLLRYPEIYSAAMLDIDHFKKINDDDGHQCGDYILREFSGIIKKKLRPYDTAVRYGGEEFLLLFPGLSGNEAVHVIERIKEKNANHEYSYNGKKLLLSFTAGIAESTGKENTSILFENIIREADEKLYHGKTAGRNKIVFNTFMIK